MNDRTRNSQKDPQLLDILFQDHSGLFSETRQQMTPNCGVAFLSRNSPFRTSSRTSKRHHNLFPYRLRRLLDDAAIEHNDHIISWLPDGKSFKVHDPDTFTTKLLGRYFSQKCFSSFTRQLYHYGFGKVDSGNFKGAFYHPKFQRDNVFSCMTMDRKTARVHLLDPTRYSTSGTEDVPRPVMKGRPRRNSSVSSKHPLPSCLFSVEEESSSKDQQNDESHHDDSRLCDSFYPGSSLDATLSSTLVPTPTTCSGSNNSSPAVSYPIPSCMSKNYAQPYQQDRIEASLDHDIPSPILDDAPWTIPFTATVHHQLLSQNQVFSWYNQDQQHRFVADDERLPPLPGLDDSTSDWLAILENLLWPCDKDISKDDMDCVSMSCILEPRSMHDMVQNPFRMETGHIASPSKFPEKGKKAW